MHGRADYRHVISITASPRLCMSCSHVKSPVASGCFACSSVRNLVKVTMSVLTRSSIAGGRSPLVFAAMFA